MYINFQQKAKTTIEPKLKDQLNIVPCFVGDPLQFESYQQQNEKCFAMVV